MKKSALCLLLALVICWTSLSQVPYAYADQEGNYTYSIDGQHATIMDFPRGAAADIIIPDTLGGLPVTAIGETAFYITDLTSVVFPDSLQSIGENAFGSNFLTSVDFPESLTSIDARAFKDNKLTSLVLPESVTSMGQEVFKDNELASVDLSDNLTTISDFAFSGNQLTSIVIPDSVTYIGGFAFRNNNLTSVSLLSRSTVIDPIAFRDNQVNSADLKIFGFSGSIVQSFALSKGFTFVDGTPLFEAIATSKQLLKNHLPGTDIGQVSTEHYHDLLDALDNAVQFVDSITFATMASDLNGAAADLNAVIHAFSNAVITADVTLSQGTYSQPYAASITEVVYGTGTYDYEVTDGQLPSGLQLTHTQIAGTPTATGDYPFTITATDSDSGQTTTIQGYTITIDQLAITVKPDAGQSKIFGTSDVVITYSVINDALQPGDTLNGTLSRNAGEAVGSYAITLGDLAHGHYEMTLAAEHYSILAATPIADTRVSAAGLTAGQTLSDSVLAGTFKHPETGISISGTLAWQDGTVRPNAGTSQQAWLFTPDDHHNYTTVGGTVQITIKGTSTDDGGSSSPTPTPAPTSTIFKSDIVNLQKEIDFIRAMVDKANNSVVKVELKDTKGHWAEKTIDTFIKLGVIQGYRDKSFKPNGNMTRAEFATILTRIFIMDTGTKSVNLKDIGTHWAKDAIEKLASLGVISGYEDGTFEPDRTISREEMIVIISSIVNFTPIADGANNSTFTDIDGSYAKEALIDAAKAGIISGKGDNKMEPKSNATRAEALTILLNILNLDPQLKTLLDGLN